MVKPDISWWVHHYCPFPQLQHLKKNTVLLYFHVFLENRSSNFVKPCSQSKLAHKFILTSVCSNECKRRGECQETNEPLLFNVTKTSFSRIQQMIKKWETELLWQRLVALCVGKRKAKTSRKGSHHLAK